MGKPLVGEVVVLPFPQNDLESPNPPDWTPMNRYGGRLSRS